MSSSCNSDLGRYENVGAHRKQHRNESPLESQAPEKVDPSVLRGMGGAWENVASYIPGGYPPDLEGLEFARNPSTRHDPATPPHSNLGTPSRPVVKHSAHIPNTSADTPESTRYRPYQPYPEYIFEDGNLLHPGRGRTRSRSLSSNRASTNGSYKSARESLSPSPCQRSHKRNHDTVSSMSSHSDAGLNDRGYAGHQSDDGTIFFTPSQSPSHTPSVFSVESRHLTHREDNDEPRGDLPSIRTPQEPWPYNEWDRYDAERLPKALNVFDEQFGGRQQ